jgi:hypothetical protein
MLADVNFGYVSNREEPHGKKHSSSMWFLSAIHARAARSQKASVNI